MATHRPLSRFGSSERSSISWSTPKTTPRMTTSGGALTEFMDEIVTMMVDAATALGPDIFSRFTEMMDARLSEMPRRLGQFEVRRAYALAVFEHDNDAARAAERVSYRPGLESTPSRQLAEAALTASAFAKFSLHERARAILVEMHEEGLGYSRPAKKDAQYILSGMRP